MEYIIGAGSCLAGILVGMFIMAWSLRNAFKSFEW